MIIEGDYQRDGVVCVRGAFSAEQIELARAAIDANLADLSPLAKRASAGDDGAFIEDFCSWPRIAEIERFARESGAAAIAAELTASATIRLYHDHVLVKEPGTFQRTPWHQDLPYYNVDGRQNVSMWIPVDPVARESTLECLAGSHLGAWFMPRTFLDGQPKWFAPGELAELPDIDADPDRFPVLGWALEPGDAVFFHMLCLHRAGYTFVTLLSMSEYYERDRAAHSEALRTAQDGRGDATLWLEYFTHGLAVQSADLKERAGWILRRAALGRLFLLHVLDPFHLAGQAHDGGGGEGRPGGALVLDEHRQLGRGGDLGIVGAHERVLPGGKALGQDADGGVGAHLRGAAGVGGRLGRPRRRDPRHVRHAPGHRLGDDGHPAMALLGRQPRHLGVVHRPHDTVRPGPHHPVHVARQFVVEERAPLVKGRRRDGEYAAPTVSHGLLPFAVVAAHRSMRRRLGSCRAGYPARP